MFPKLNYPVIAGLDRAYLDAVDEAYEKHDGDQLTERETKEFVLMHCFSIVPKLIKTPVDLLKVLLSLHARKVRLPDFLVDYLLESLSKDTTFETWPLADILPSREGSLRFLQDEWAALPRLSQRRIRRNDAGFRFSHEDVRAYIDTFFLDGSLTPVEQDRRDEPARLGHERVWSTIPKPMPCAGSVVCGRSSRQKFPTAEASHRDWQQAAQRWAELVVLRWEWDEALDAADRTAWAILQAKVEDAFGQWMMQRYGSLHNLPYHQQPVMVHHIPRFLAVERTRKKLPRSPCSCWMALPSTSGSCCGRLLKPATRHGGSRNRRPSPGCRLSLPSPASRSSPGSRRCTSRIPWRRHRRKRAHWLRFWEDQGVQRPGSNSSRIWMVPHDPKLETALANPRLSVLGIVWNKVDDIMHGMQMQTAGMHNQVRLWASQGHLQQLLGRLHQEGFAVYLTADHGNVTATGIGNPREGVLAETRGKRARVYDRPEFRDEVATKFPESIRWPNYGLPPARHVLLAGDLKAFTDEGDEIVSHGGIALEEVMVPFVAITREGA